MSIKATVKLQLVIEADGIWPPDAPVSQVQKQAKENVINHLNRMVFEYEEKHGLVKVSINKPILANIVFREEAPPGETPDV